MPLATGPHNTPGPNLSSRGFEPRSHPTLTATHGDGSICVDRVGTVTPPDDNRSGFVPTMTSVSTYTQLPGQPYPSSLPIRPMSTITQARSAASSARQKLANFICVGARAIRSSRRESSRKPPEDFAKRITVSSHGASAARHQSKRSLQNSQPVRLPARSI
jgi:hypothetical protein